MKTKLEAIRSLYNALERASMGGAFRFRDVEAHGSELRLAAMRLDRINLNRCNGIERWDSAVGRRLASWTEADESAAEKAALRHANSALAVLDKMNTAGRQQHGRTFDSFRLRFNGDPRGAAIKIFVEPDDPVSGNASAYF